MSCSYLRKQNTHTKKWKPKTHRFYISARKNCKNQRRNRNSEKGARSREKKIGGGQERKIERTT